MSGALLVDTARGLALQRATRVTAIAVPVCAVVIVLALGQRSIPVLVLAVGLTGLTAWASRQPPEAIGPRLPAVVAVAHVVVAAGVVLIPDELAVAGAAVWLLPAVAAPVVTLGSTILLSTVLMAGGVLAAAVAHGWSPTTVLLLSAILVSVRWLTLRTTVRMLAAIRLDEEAAAQERAAADLLGSVEALGATDRDTLVRSVVEGLVASGLSEVAVALAGAMPIRVDGAGADGAWLDAVLARVRGRDAPTRLHVEGRDAVVHPLHDHGLLAGHLVVGAATGVVEPEAENLCRSLAGLMDRALESIALLDDRDRVLARLADLDLRQTDVVASVSHELRTPLTVVLGIGETVASGAARVGTPATDDLLDRMAANVDRLDGMLTTLLDTSRMRLGTVRPASDPVDLARLADDVVRRLLPLSADHRVSLHADDGAWAHGDGPLLEHVVENLLVNAVRHTPAGTSVTVQVEVVDARVRVAVVDDGPGIPTDELPRLTDRFYRGGGGNGGYRNTSGLGLGLSIVEDVLAAHGSRLEVSSRVGSGARFAFTLPLVD